MPDVVERMLVDYLTAAQKSLIKAVDPDGPPTSSPRFGYLVERATLTGMCAYLLSRLNDTAPSLAADAAAALMAFADDGEPLADWVTDQLARRAVDVEAMIEGERSHG